MVKDVKRFNLPFWLFGLSGMAALIYEVVWTRALSLVLGSTTYALSTMLASFMAGLSIGAILGGWLADRSERPVRLFILLESGIAVSGLLAIPLINMLPTIYAKVYYSFHQSFSSFSLVQFAVCFLVMLIPTTLMGATFPVVCKINFIGGEKIGRETGSVYAVNTVGAIAGALLAGFVLVPNLGVRQSNMAAAFVNIFIAVTLSLSLKGDERWRSAGKVFAVFISALIISSLVLPAQAYPVGFYIASKYKSYDEYKDSLQRKYRLWKKLYEKDNIQGNVKVFEISGSGGRAMMTNGRIEGHEISDMLNTSLLAYLPASIDPEARSFLSIGLGTGNTVYFAATMTHLREIYSIEINPAVDEAVRRFFHPELFEDGRIRFITADARNYLMLVDKKYDIISSEPSYPVDQGFSHLFSKEFFELVRSRLSENGVYCQWVPAYLFNSEEMTMILKTFSTVFPNTTVWGVNEIEALFIGSAGDSPQPVHAMKERVDEWLRANGIDPSYKLYLDSSNIKDAVKGYAGKINTDDMPVLEFYATRNMIAPLKD